MDWEEAVIDSLGVILPVWLACGAVLGLLVAGAALLQPKRQIRSTQEKEEDHA